MAKSLLSLILLFLASYISAHAQGSNRMLMVTLSGQKGNTLLQDMGSPTSIGPDQAGRLFSLYPNPSHSSLSLEFASNPVGTVSFKIYDLTGKLVKTQQFVAAGNTNRYNVDLTGVNPGSYFLRVDVGELHQTMRFIRE